MLNVYKDLWLYLDILEIYNSREIDKNIVI